MPEWTLGAGQGAYRVNRGGSWNNEAANCRAANRNNHEPGVRISGLGFRPAPAPPAPDRSVRPGWNRSAIPDLPESRQMLKIRPGAGSHDGFPGESYGS